MNTEQTTPTASVQPENDAQISYLCGCTYPAAYNAYHDLNCAKCHREAWEAHTAPSKRAQAYLRRDLAARKHARLNGYKYEEYSRPF